MKLLKKENWWIWLLLLLFSNGSSTMVLGALLDVYDKKAWYANWKYWIIGLLLFVIPFIVMVYIFYIQILCQTAAKLKVKGSEYYLSPYLWIVCIIIPFIGWLAAIIGFLYLHIATLVALANGNLEIKKG